MFTLKLRSVLIPSDVTLDCENLGLRGDRKGRILGLQKGVINDDIPGEIWGARDVAPPLGVVYILLPVRREGRNDE